MNAFENAIEQNPELPTVFARVWNAAAVQEAGPDWLGVTLDDYDALFKASVKPAEAPVPATRDDAATRQLLQHMLDIIAEVEVHESFAGFQIQEMRNDEGKLLSVRLVACDVVAGIVSPRTL